MMMMLMILLLLLMTMMTIMMIMITIWMLESAKLAIFSLAKVERWHLQEKRFSWRETFSISQFQIFTICQILIFTFFSLYTCKKTEPAGETLFNFNNINHFQTLYQVLWFVFCTFYSITCYICRKREFSWREKIFWILTDWFLCKIQISSGSL